MKKIIFLTGTRADFGKIKALLASVDADAAFDLHIFVTGMHLLEEYGMTYIEVEKAGYGKIFKCPNQIAHDDMDAVLSKTIMLFSQYIKSVEPDLIVIHGDRVEALAGATVGVLNNILVAHIEGGEVSGTVDELIRHATSKMSHLHFVSNDSSSLRLQQMGERKDSIYAIGSPEKDIMLSNDLPSFKDVKEYYQIAAKKPAIVLFHPVTTEVDEMDRYAQQFVDALIESDQNFVVIYPNNDTGAQFILREYERLRENPRFRLIPSMRFEAFLSLAKNASFIIGNSSSGVREAPFLGLPSVNVGTRQSRRSVSPSIVNSDYSTKMILDSISQALTIDCAASKEFGEGSSSSLFMKTLKDHSIWKTPVQKIFIDL